DAEHLRVKARHDLLAAGDHDLGVAAYLDPAGHPWVDRGHVVDHEGHPPVVADIAELLALGEAVAADVDRIQVRVVAEAHRHRMRPTVRADRGQAAQSLALQIGKLGGREDTHLAPQPHGTTGDSSCPSAYQIATCSAARCRNTETQTRVRRSRAWWLF